MEQPSCVTVALGLRLLSDDLLPTERSLFLFAYVLLAVSTCIDDCGSTSSCSSDLGEALEGKSGTRDAWVDGKMREEPREPVAFNSGSDVGAARCSNVKMSATCVDGLLCGKPRELVASSDSDKSDHFCSSAWNPSPAKLEEPPATRPSSRTSRMAIVDCTGSSVIGTSEEFMSAVEKENPASDNDT